MSNCGRYGGHYSTHLFNWYGNVKFYDSKDKLEIQVRERKAPQLCSHISCYLLLLVSNHANEP